jgi:Ca-activated chloride channel family protein
MKKVIWILLVARMGAADGIIIPKPPMPDKPIKPLAVEYHRVEVTISDQVAKTSIDQVFINHLPRDIEGTYIFPLPEDAAISDFAIYSDGVRLSGEILDKEEARAIYEDIVRRMKDPGLLEYVGQNLFRARVYPIPARGKKRIELVYEEILTKEGEVCKYRYPLKIERLSYKPIEEVEIDVEIESELPIKAIYSPSHKIEIERENERYVKAVYYDENVMPDRDFLLYYTTSREEIALSVITHKRRREDGFFLLMVSPRYEKGEALPKDITFVLDTSGSMAGRKISQAKEALSFCVESLNEEDMFNIVRFSSDVERLSDEMLSVDKDSVESALDFIDGLKASGGTNIKEALLTALEHQPENRPHIIIFLTDGLPTVGERDVAVIVNEVKKKNRGSRIFVFGVGDNVNTHLLDLISGQNSGASMYVRPEEDIETVISSFYNKVAYPALSSISISYSPVKVYDTYPKELSDIFFGGQLILLGRYEKEGEATITLTGMVGDRERLFLYSCSFPERKKNPFLPRLWATRKIGYLLDQIRLYGEDEELVEEIKALSKRYGIMTPYTSFLVTEDEPEEMMRERFMMLQKEVGRMAVMSAKELGALKREEVVREDVAVRYVEGVTYVLKRGVWQDIEYKGEETEKIEYESREYFDLAKELGKVLALGKRVIFKHKDKWYEVVE